MPYIVRYIKGAKKPYKIIRKDTGKVVGSSSSASQARASIRARYAGEKNK